MRSNVVTFPAPVQFVERFCDTLQREIQVKTTFKWSNVLPHSKAIRGSSLHIQAWYLTKKLDES